MVNVEELRTLLSETLQVPVDNIANDQDLSEVGLNSIMAVELIVTIEERFQVLIMEEDLKQDNFRTIDAIMKLIENSPAYTGGSED